MIFAKHLLEGLKLAAPFSAVAVVVWNMPENCNAAPEGSADKRLAINRYSATG